MKLTFDLEQVKTLINHAQSCQSIQPTFDQLFDPDYRFDGQTPSLEQKVNEQDVDLGKLPKSLWLVGDEGVYLMSSGKPHLPDPHNDDPNASFVVYANECHPKKMSHDDWWENKVASFGTYDGVELLLLSEIQRLMREQPEAHWLIIDMSSELFKVDVA